MRVTRRRRLGRRPCASPRRAVRDRVRENNHRRWPMTAVLPNLIIGGFAESFDFDLLALAGVTHILNVAEECEVLERVGRTYAEHAIADDCDRSDISKILPACMVFIRDAHAAGGCVFVHRLEGVGRSACICACFMVERLAWTHDRALAHTCPIAEVHERRDTEADDTSCRPCTAVEGCPALLGVCYTKRRRLHAMYTLFTYSSIAILRKRPHTLLHAAAWCLLSMNMYSISTGSSPVITLKTSCSRRDSYTAV